MTHLPTRSLLSRDGPRPNRRWLLFFLALRPSDSSSFAQKKKKKNLIPPLAHTSPATASLCRRRRRRRIPVKTPPGHDGFRPQRRPTMAPPSPSTAASTFRWLPAPRCRCSASQPQRFPATTSLGLPRHITVTPSPGHGSSRARHLLASHGVSWPGRSWNSNGSSRWKILV